LPEPTVIEVIPRGVPQKNEFWVAARQLERLAAAGPVLAADWVAAENWPTAVRRMGSTVGAWGRYGPVGSDQLKVALVPGEHLDEIRRVGVALMSDLKVQPRE